MDAQKEKIIYLVTDTSWWLEEGWRIATDVARRLKDGKAFFVVPAGVMRELDGLKKAKGDKGKRALESTKRIHELVSMRRAKIVKGNGKYYNTLTSKIDEEVVAAAKNLKDKGKKVLLLSIDHAQRALAENMKVTALCSIPLKRKNEPKWFDKDVFWFLTIVGVLGLPFGAGGFLFFLFFIISGFVLALWPLFRLFSPITSSTKEDEPFGSFCGYQSGYFSGYSSGYCRSLDDD